jgi:hypothetical protein
MGYRQYLYSIDTWLVDEIKKCKTKDDFIKTMQKYRNDIVEYDPFDEQYYVPLYKIGDELYEFGKYYENSEEMYKHGDSLFSSDELNEDYCDYGAIVLEADGLLCALDWQRQHIIEMYKDLLREKSAREWDARSQLDRLIENAKDYLAWWEYADGPADLDREHECLVHSWLYEHTYFELARIYKTFDWDNKSMLFMGW